MHQPNASEGCPSNAELVELVEGRLSASAREALKEHLAGCDACAAMVDGLTSEEEREALGASDRLDLGTAQAILGEPTPTWIDGPAEPATRMAAATLSRGTPIGRYLVLSLIGRGGMGEVYAAYDPDLDRRVALKLLHTRQDAQRARARLLREARALGKLSHPNVVQVYDVGEHDGDVFVAMELVEGKPLGAFCEGPPRPGWREVLAAYRDAARGLAAAHAQGIVHRDVKPANILRGDDGRVRVADFGLAAGRWQPGDGRDTETRAATAREASTSGGDVGPATDGWQPGEGRDAGTAPELSDTTPGRSDANGDGEGRLTATGTLLGTPLYMAPEQFEGPGVGPASDQHSLCTALYEGLYGALPFTFPGGPTPAVALLALKKKGLPRAPPPGSPVPPSIYRAIARGLAPEPAARFPSMDALVEALREEPPERRTRLRNAAIGGVALVAIVAATRGATREDPCAHPERQLAGAWDDDVRGRVRAALLGTGLSYADDTATRVAQLVDRYTTSWAAMRREVCEAGRSGKQRPQVVAMRDACLDRRLGQVHALTATLAEKADRAVVDKGVEAAAGLPGLAACADVEALTARVRPPESAETRARVAALEPRVDRLEALHWAGKFHEGLRDGEALLTEVGTLDYAPLRARVEIFVGKLRKGAGDQEGAKALFHQAAVSAALGRDEELSARAWAELLNLVIAQRRLDEAKVIRALAPTAVGRTADVETQARWANVEGLFLWRKGDLAEARVALARAVSLRTQALGPDHPDVATSLGNLAIVAGTAGAYAEARSLFEQAVAIREKAQGPDHPETTVALTNLGATLAHMGEYAPAVAVDERVLAVVERTRGTDNDDFGFALSTLGEARSAMGDYPAAVALCTRALAIREKALGPDHPSIANVLANLGHARARLGQLDAARPLLERALAVREKAQGASHPDLSEPLLYLGDLALARGAPAEAAALLERALALHDPDSESEVQLTLAEALWKIGKDRPRARTLADQARSRYERIGHRPGQDRAARWLADHPL
jgi:serine/threonine protein kinase/tetratricopeptide (TPR) repeat protein